MNKLICTLSLLSLGLRVAIAADEPAPANTQEAAEPKSNAPAQLEVKNKSSFTMDQSGRNPFWPVGWRPASKVVTQNTSDHAGQDIPPTAFLVSSITVDTGGRFAIINGKVMNEGQVFGLQMGTQTYQLTVKQIRDAQVSPARRDQKIIFPLRRR